MTRSALQGKTMLKDDIRLILACGIFIALASQSVCLEYFHGYPCKANCSGHKAGYEWAARRGIRSASGCTGTSKSFIEGCKAYVDATNPLAKILAVLIAICVLLFCARLLFLRIRTRIPDLS